MYLTRNNDFTINTDIDRVFIMVLAGSSMANLRKYYTDELGVPVGDAMPFEITMISKAQNLPMDTIYPLALATVSQQFLLELDEYPAGAPARTVTEGYLPPGTAMVAFEVDDLDAAGIALRAEPAAIDSLPYAGRRVAVTVGSSGEWIELIETAD